MKDQLAQLLLTCMDYGLITMTVLILKPVPLNNMMKANFLHQLFLVLTLIGLDYIQVLNHSDLTNGQNTEHVTNNKNLPLQQKQDSYQKQVQDKKTFSQLFYH